MAQQGTKTVPERALHGQLTQEELLEEVIKDYRIEKIKTSFLSTN